MWPPWPTLHRPQWKSVCSSFWTYLACFELPHWLRQTSFLFLLSRTLLISCADFKGDERIHFDWRKNKLAVFAVTMAENVGLYRHQAACAFQKYQNLALGQIQTTKLHKNRARELHWRATWITVVGLMWPLGLKVDTGAIAHARRYQDVVKVLPCKNIRKTWCLSAIPYCLLTLPGIQNSPSHWSLCSPHRPHWTPPHTYVS